MKPARNLAALGLLVLPVVHVTPAYAAPDRLELSSDGVTWTATLTEPVFADTPALVPLGSVAGSFYVRNASRMPARVSLELIPPVPPDALAEHLSVSTRIGPVRASQPVAPPSPDGCRTSVTGTTMRPGDWQRVDVGLHLADLDGQTAQGATTELSLVVHLTQATGRGVTTVCGLEGEADAVAGDSAERCELTPVPLVGEADDPCGGSLGSATGGGGGPKDGADTARSAGPRAGEAGPGAGELSARTTADGGLLDDGALLPSRDTPGSVAGLALTAAGLLGLGGALLVLNRRRLSGTRAPARSTTPGGR